MACMLFRRFGRGGLRAWWLLGVLLCANRPASADEAGGSFQPGKGRGVRTAEVVTSAVATSEDATTADATSADEAEAQAEPSSSLVQGPEEIPSEAHGLSLDDTTDPELRALLEADRSLFPEPLLGVKPGFDFGLEREEAVHAPPGAPLLRDVFPGAEEAWLRGVAMPNFPTRLDERVVRYLRFYRDDPRGQAIIRVFAKRSGRYSSWLRSRVLKANLPTDILWLSLIESGHNPKIRSHVGAAGLWQFMPASGIHYGLSIDRYVDERLDPEKSTLAAIKYLSDLKQRFGNWELAMAAYNMGLGALGEAISKFNCNDYWELSRYEGGLPWETTLYVPKIVAMSIVMNNPEAFGLNPTDFDPAEQYETVRIAGGTSFKQIAFVAGVSSQALADLNPQYVAGKLPPLSAKSQRWWPLHVPLGTGERVQQKLGNKKEGILPSTVSVKLGETAASIAAARNVNLAGLKAANGVASDEEVKVGDVLQLPKAFAVLSQAPEVPRVVVAPRAFAYLTRERVFYPVRGDESLADIARAFETSTDELMAWNALDETARLQPKMVLQVFIKKGTPPSRVRFLRDAEVTPITAGTAEFYDQYEAQKGRRRVVIAAKPADTLTSIARRYKMSQGMIERVNRRARSDTLLPGEAVIVYLDKSIGKLGHELFQAPTRQIPEQTTPLPRRTSMAQTESDL